MPVHSHANFYSALLWQNRILFAYFESSSAKNTAEITSVRDRRANYAKTKLFLRLQVNFRFQNQLATSQLILDVSIIHCTNTICYKRHVSTEWDVRMSAIATVLRFDSWIGVCCRRPRCYARSSALYRHLEWFLWLFCWILFSIVWFRPTHWSQCEHL